MGTALHQSRCTIWKRSALLLTFIIVWNLSRHQWISISISLHCAALWPGVNLYTTPQTVPIHIPCTGIAWPENSRRESDKSSTTINWVGETCQVKEHRVLKCTLKDHEVNIPANVLVAQEARASTGPVRTYLIAVIMQSNITWYCTW